MSGSVSVISGVYVRTLSWFVILIVATLPDKITSAQSYGQPDSGQPGDAMVQAFLGYHAQQIHRSYLDGINTLDDWLEKRPQYKEEYFYMLGLSPLPEKSPLQPTVTGTLNKEGYVVDKLYFQSRPGLYVTGNLYRPSDYEPGKRLPAILYVCGHGFRGRNGNKTAYQSHGIWFARHGYVCLLLDTLQMGEIAAIHHGTYRENRWWWHSRGYTSAGVEAWNGIRAIDYLQSRSDVDPNRIGVTGISGGGAATFWVAAADERVKVAIPVSGMADLPSYLPNRVINGHCDCMFLYNTYQWPWTRIAALIAPRPLQFINSDQDRIFPMDANQRVSNRLETLYSLYGASDQVETVVSIGGHAYREDIRKATFRYMNSHLKNDPSPVTDSEVDLVTGPRGQEVHPIPPEELRVFPTDADIPADELNTTIDQHFVPIRKLSRPEEGKYSAWKSSLEKELRQYTFRSFPQSIPAAVHRGTDPSGALILETEPGTQIQLRKIQENASKNRIRLVVDMGDPSSETLTQQSRETDVVYICQPRGIGATTWTVKDPPNYVARSFALLGRTVDDGRVWDITATARYLLDAHEGKIPLTIAGSGAGAVLGAYAMFLEPEIHEADFSDIPASHMEDSCPDLLNVLRVCDVPDILGALAPRTVSINRIDRQAGKKTQQIYQAANAESRLRIDY